MSLLLQGGQGGQNRGVLSGDVGGRDTAAAPPLPPQAQLQGRGESDDDGGQAVRGRYRVDRDAPTLLVRDKPWVP